MLPDKYKNYALPPYYLLAKFNLEEVTYCFSIICTKCPLHQHFFKYLQFTDLDIVEPENLEELCEKTSSDPTEVMPDRFTPERLVENLNSDLTLKYVVNLCSTTRYYSPKRFPKTLDYRYNNLNFYFGHTTDQILRTVNDIRSKLRNQALEYKNFKDGSEKVPAILIHCTHGINRTALFFYLLIKNNYKDAGALFKSFRGYYPTKHLKIKENLDKYLPGVNSELPDLEFEVIKKPPFCIKEFVKIGYSL